MPTTTNRTLLLQQLLRRQQRQRAPSRENHCPRPTVTSTISTKPCQRRSWRSSSAYARFMGNEGCPGHHGLLGERCLSL